MPMPLCPACNISMESKIVKRGSNKGNRFYGCPNFPQCDETMEYFDLFTPDDLNVLSPISPDDIKTMEYFDLNVDLNVNSSDDAITPDQARRAIYIDFEGTMNDPASFLGALVINDAGHEEFKQFVFEKDLWPVLRHHEITNKQTEGYAPQEAYFLETISALRRRAENESRKIIAYSVREIGEIFLHIKSLLTKIKWTWGEVLGPNGEELDPEELKLEFEWWKTNLVNALPIAKAWAKIHHPYVAPRVGFAKPGESTYSLEQFLPLTEYKKVYWGNISNISGRTPSFLFYSSAYEIKKVRYMLNKYEGDDGKGMARAKRLWISTCVQNWHHCRGARELMMTCSNAVPMPPLAVSDSNDDDDPADVEADLDEILKDRIASGEDDDKKSFCSQCGEKLTVGAKFCSECGAAV